MTAYAPTYLQPGACRVPLGRKIRGGGRFRVQSYCSNITFANNSRLTTVSGFIFINLLCAEFMFMASNTVFLNFKSIAVQSLLYSPKFTFDFQRRVRRNRQQIKKEKEKKQTVFNIDIPYLHIPLRGRRLCNYNSYTGRHRECI